MNFQEAVKSVFSKYATFKGRSMRSEYWYFILFTFICNIVLNLIHPTISTFFGYAIFIPGLAVLVRRLHDVGKSGWYSLVLYGPMILFFGYFIYLFRKIGISNLQNVTPEDIERIFQENNAAAPVGILGLLFLGGVIYMIVLLCTDSQPDDNVYGPNPKTGLSENEINSIGNTQNYNQQ